MGEVTISADFILQVVVLIGTLGGAWAITRQQVVELARRVDSVEKHHDTHVDKLDKLCNEVSALVGRFDMMLNLGRAAATANRSRA